MLSDIRCYRPQEVSMRLTARIALIVGVIVAASTLPAVGQQGPIRIGASLSLTGSYAKLGSNQHEGHKLCERDLNAKGGLLGRKVEIVVYDDQSPPPPPVPSSWPRSGGCRSSTRRRTRRATRTSRRCSRRSSR